MPVKIFMIIVCLLIFDCFTSCVEKFNPILEQYENLLVVDGYFTDETKRHEIKLFTTTSVYSTEFIPFSGAVVKVVSSDGEEIIFQESNERGTYYSVMNVEAIPGKEYKLSVSINNIIFYETDYQRLISSPQIDSIHFVRESRQTWEIDETLDGLQFLLDMKNDASRSNYFLWKLIETYEYDAEMFIDSYFAGNFYDFPDEDSLFTCWKTSTLPDFFTHSVIFSKNKAIKDFPLHYVANNSKRLSKRYSLLVKQFSLNEDAFNFWNTVREQSEGEGELYSKQPFQVRGNLKNINNPNEVVLGYFTVAGVSQKRIFVDKPNGMSFPSLICIPDPMAIAYITSSDPEEWPYYLSIGELGRGVVDRFCVDCRERGGDILKPDFWK